MAEYIENISDLVLHEKKKPVSLLQPITHHGFHTDTNLRI